MQKQARNAKVGYKKKSIGQLFKEQWPLVMLALPAVILIIVFKYGPMYGILIAFKDYKASLGIWGSPWKQPFYANFQQFFNYVNFKQLISNTLRVGIVTLLFTYPAPIIFALLLNELKLPRFKRVVQTVSYLPHFISVVVVVGMMTNFASLGGLFNVIRGWFGFEAVNMNSGDTYFLFMYISSALWQGIGWGSIIYLSALSNVDVSLYDVANIDGANRWHKVRHIAWPAIRPTTTVILIMNVGNVLSQDFTKILLMQNDTNRSLIDVIATYVHRMGIQQGQFEYATAVNLFVSLIAFVLVFSTNKITQRIDPDNSLW